MKKIWSTEEYIENHKERKEELELLLSLARRDGRMKETIKWSIPVFTVNNKNVLGIGAFKSYIGLWFYNGVYLDDKYSLLINANEDETKALRQMRFGNLEEIEKQKLVISEYISEAIENQQAGLEMKAEKKAEIEIPEILLERLESDAKLKKSFESLSPYKQREYCEHIGSAKREATREKRLNDSLELLSMGVGLHDKYRKG